MYENGLGVKQDINKAIELYTKESENNSDQAKYNLGYIYENGLGVKKDKSKAEYWYSKIDSKEKIEKCKKSREKDSQRLKK